MIFPQKISKKPKKIKNIIDLTAINLLRLQRLLILIAKMYLLKSNASIS